MFQHCPVVVCPYLCTSKGANVEWRGIGLEEGRGIVTTRPVAAGAELLLSYGCKGNAEFALGYGFAMWGNPYEEARLLVDLRDFVDPEGPGWAASLAAFEGVLDGEHGGALGCRRRGAGSVAVRLTEEDVEAPGREAAVWASLCRLCGTCGPQWREVLREALLSATEDLMRSGPDGEPLDSEAWEDYYYYYYHYYYYCYYYYHYYD